MNDATPIIRKGRKFDQVLDGARQVFMEGGFERASVDEIARVAGVSKATLYSYFPDKRLLFVEVLRSVCEGQARYVLDQIDKAAPPREVLGFAGRSFLRFVSTGPGLQIFRICVSETAEFPELGRAAFESGPEVMRVEMGAYFACAEARGELKIDDYALAAAQFAEMCKAEIWISLLFGVKDTVTEAEIDRVVDGAVDTFMARYGT
ncbi:MAG: TetR/AcrR family transcriptional regulator [Pseudomonadota bacterium]